VSGCGNKNIINIVTYTEGTRDEMTGSTSDD
jgi:hypothetical protein